MYPLGTLLPLPRTRRHAVAPGLPAASYQGYHEGLVVGSKKYFLETTAMSSFPFLDTRLSVAKLVALRTLTRCVGSIVLFCMITAYYPLHYGQCVHHNIRIAPADGVRHLFDTCVAKLLPVVG